MIEFSVAGKINVFIETESMNVACARFLNFIYRDFLPPVKFPAKAIKLRVGELVASNEDVVKLGGDAFYAEDLLRLATGHQFKKIESVIEIVIPRKVKRGRIPFKRITPGRHISDEIVEPLLVFLLQEQGLRCYHASSMLKEDGGAIINIAWRGTGKTNCILPYIFSGRVLSDDLSFVDDESGILYSYPRPLRLYSYNIDFLDVSKITKLKLHLKSKFTPPWQPVQYISLRPEVSSVRKYTKVYLNGTFSKLKEHEFGSESLFASITDFEFSHFAETKAMLKMAGILDS